MTDDSRGGVRTGRDPRWKRVGDVSEMGVLSGLSWVTWLAERMPVRLVPGEYWALDAEDEKQVAIVSCPCGHQPVVPALAQLTGCGEPNVAQGEECKCQRYFFFDGSDVWCFNVEGADDLSVDGIEWWDEPERNARLYRHRGCDEGDAPWVVPLDDCAPPGDPTRECARCCEILPLAPRRE